MARSDKIVLDASVVIKWYVEEELTDKAVEILNDYSDGLVDILSVQLMPFEVLNALRYNPQLGTSELTKVCESLTRTQITLFPLLDGLYQESVSIAFKYGTTIYDAAYLSLAITTDCILYTADAKFRNKVGRNAHLSMLSER